MHAPLFVTSHLKFKKSEEPSTLIPSPDPDDNFLSLSLLHFCAEIFVIFVQNYELKRLQEARKEPEDFCLDFFASRDPRCC